MRVHERFDSRDNMIRLRAWLRNERNTDYFRKHGTIVECFELEQDSWNMEKAYVPNQEIPSFFLRQFDEENWTAKSMEGRPK